jgi:hypothetical protein
VFCHRVVKIYKIKNEMLQFPSGVQDLSSAVAVLTAMITPAVLISACGTLILSTSTRLGRAVDRVRKLLDRLEELAHTEEELELIEERRKFIYEQLGRLTRRNRYLQRAMQGFYSALGIFIACSVSIGLVAVTGRGYEWLPAVLGLTGASFLFYGSILLILETRLASQTLFSELDFTLKLSKEFVPSAIVMPTDGVGRKSIAPFIRLVKRKNEPETTEESE